MIDKKSDPDLKAASRETQFYLRHVSEGSLERKENKKSYYFSSFYIIIIIESAASWQYFFRSTQQKINKEAARSDYK